MHVYYAGAQTEKDPRKCVKRDLNCMTTYWDFRKKDKPKFIMQLKRARSRQARRKLEE